MAIRDAAVAQLQNFAIPSSGTLKLDYVSYQVSPLGESGLIYTCITKLALC